MNYEFYERKREYAEYRRTEEWREVRRRVWDKAKGKCERCGRSEGRRDVHHLHYDGVIFHELEGDNLRFVVLYCENCHEWAHPEYAAARDRVPTLSEVMAMIRDHRGR